MAPGPYVRPVPENGEFTWATRHQNYPVTEMYQLPSLPPVQIPQIQANFGPETARQERERKSRQLAVKESFLHSWKGYKDHAWLQDEVTPVAGGSRHSFGWATTLIDSLDTLWIMGERKEFEEAIYALRKGIDLTSIEADTRSVFETTIRHFGGLLAAYDVSRGKYPILLDMAVEMGDMLYAAFDTPNRMPVNWWRWESAKANAPQMASSATSIAELGSLTLEFTRLSQLTQDPKFFDAVQRITDELERSQDSTRLPGMWPLMNDAGNLLFGIDNRFSLGALSDSTYEYLPKQHLMLGGVARQYRTMYEKCIDVVKRHIFFRPMLPANNDILLSGTVRVDAVDGRVTLDPEGQHLACFTGGMVDLAAKIFDHPEDSEIAKKLVDGCVWAYDMTQTGIMPESFSVVACEDRINCEWDYSKWNQTKDSDSTLPLGITRFNDRKYLLRPEAIESVFVHYRMTADIAYQESAWRMFQSIEKATRTEIASSAIRDVTSTNPPKMDSMESFWLGETLKYFYLIFSEPDVISLDDYVLNTEAHPLRRPV